MADAHSQKAWFEGVGVSSVCEARKVTFKMVTMGVGAQPAERRCDNNDVKKALLLKENAEATLD